MRNYVALNLTRALYADNQGNLFSRLIWGTDLGNLEANLTWMTNQVASPLQELSDEGIQYVLLDKRNLAELFTVLGSGFPFNVISGVGYFFQKDPMTDQPGPIPSTNTPRKGWKDAAGVERKPTPSDSATTRPEQGNILLSFVQNLGLLFDQLVAAGQLTLAGKLAVFILKIENNEPWDAAALDKLLDSIIRILA